MDPVPTSPTRLPVKSTPSSGHRDVWYQGPSNASSPGRSGTWNSDRHPAAETKYRAVTVGAVRRRHGPRGRGRVPGGPGHPRVQLDVRPQAELVRDVVEVPQDLRLRRVPLAPGPLLLKLGGEGVRVVLGLDVAPRPRVAVPEPGPADPVPGLERPHRQPGRPERVHRVDPGKPRSHHHDVKVGHRAAPPSQTSHLTLGEAKTRGQCPSSHKLCHHPCGVPPSQRLKRVIPNEFSLRLSAHPFLLDGCAGAGARGRRPGQSCRQRRGSDRPWRMRRRSHRRGCSSSCRGRPRDARKR